MKWTICLLLTTVTINVFAQNYDEIANLKTGDYEDQTSSITGLWAVKQVSVGEEELTPTAKWFEFHTDGTQISGNGWVQNFKGQWQFDAAAKTMLSLDQEGNADEYGAFKVVLSDSEMSWQRIEDGMSVKVSLYRIDEKPLAPWDNIVGRWEALGLETQNTETGEGSVADLEGFSYYFGWDRRYRKFDSSGKRVETGIWHIESHSLWLWLIPDNGGPKLGQEIVFEKNWVTFIEKDGPIIEKIRFEKN